MADIGTAALQIIFSLGKGHCIKTREMAENLQHTLSQEGFTVWRTYLFVIKKKCLNKGWTLSRRLVVSLTLVSKI